MAEQLKAVAIFFIGLILLSLIASWLGLNSGHGGNPQEEYYSEF